MRQLPEDSLFGPGPWQVGLWSGSHTASYTATASSSSQALKDIQVALNDVAWTITGAKRSDRTPVPVLLKSPGIPSSNTVVVRSLALETWKAYRSCDGRGCEKKTLGKAIFNTNKRSLVSHVTRSSAQELVPLPFPMAAQSTMLMAVGLWNSYRGLKEANTLSAAQNIARAVSASAPI